MIFEKPEFRAFFAIQRRFASAATADSSALQKGQTETPAANFDRQLVSLQSDRREGKCCEGDESETVDEPAEQSQQQSLLERSDIQICRCEQLTAIGQAQATAVYDEDKWSGGGHPPMRVFGARGGCTPPVRLRSTRFLPCCDALQLERTRNPVSHLNKPLTECSAVLSKFTPGPRASTLLPLAASCFFPFVPPRRHRSVRRPLRLLISVEVPRRTRSGSDAAGRRASGRRSAVGKLHGVVGARFLRKMTMIRIASDRMRRSSGGGGGGEEGMRGEKELRFKCAKHGSCTPLLGTQTFRPPLSRFPAATLAGDRSALALGQEDSTQSLLVLWLHRERSLARSGKERPLVSVFAGDAFGVVDFLVHSAATAPLRMDGRELRHLGTVSSSGLCFVTKRETFCRPPTFSPTLAVVHYSRLYPRVGVLASAAKRRRRFWQPMIASSIAATSCHYHSVTKHSLSDLPLGMRHGRDLPHSSAPVTPRASPGFTARSVANGVPKQLIGRQPEAPPSSLYNPLVNQLSSQQRPNSFAKYRLLKMYGPTSRNAAVPKDIYQTDPERQNRHSRSAESSSEIIFSDSPRSFNNNELEDYIIDEVLSYEDEVRGSSNKPGQLPASFSCSDNLTGMSNNARSSASRPINATGSSGNSVQSGSPGRTIPIQSPLSSSSFRQIVSSSAPSSSLDMEALVRGSNASQLPQHHGNGGQTPNSNDEFFRDRRKKDIHNMIERRRRYNINDRIKELGLMLPKHSAEDIKLNKGTILKASCDYIRQLQRDRDMYVKQQSQNAKLEQTARQYADRIRELEAQLEKHGVAVPPASLPTYQPPSNVISAARTIKQEPFDDPSPSATPTGSLPSQGFMSQLSEMQIASPVSSYGRSPLNSGLQYFTPSSDSPLSPPVPGLRGHVSTNANSEYGTPSSGAWPNTGIHQNIPFHDLAMDDLTSLQGDPMISAGCFPHSQMSPEIQWDQAGFSPDSSNAVHQVAATSTCSQMDFS
uniref:BHLH domain-containing protein n=1 Tax=Steinernema glaseri TaxID=37863 RepID=A0A1I7ZQ84_9BILA